MSADRVQEELPLDTPAEDIAAVEATARDQGWVPKEEFRGKEDKWVDAKTFVERNENILPILRKNNERLTTANQLLERKLAALESRVEAQDRDYETFQEFHKEETARRVKEARQNLLKELKEAKQDNDVDREIELMSQISEIDATEQALKSGEKGEKDEKPTKSAPMAETPAYMAWKAQNPWFEVDQERSFEVMQVAQRMLFDMQSGKIAPIRDEAFFTELNKRIASQNGRPAAGKVEGSRGGSTSSSRNGRTYADLPAEAKKICDNYAKQFVKPNGRWKTIDDYRKHYVKQLEETGGFDS